MSGRVLVRGHDMLSGPADLHRRVRREHLGAVFQDPMTSLNPTMRSASRSRRPLARTRRRCGCCAPWGSRRRAQDGLLPARAVRRAAAAGDDRHGGGRRSALIIADEPTTALDVTMQAQALGLLRSLRDEIGCSVLLITHGLGVAAQVADRVAVMYAGRLAEFGPAATVLRSAAHPTAWR
jgi:peptide/nickel transport system ATP-binding protein